VAGPVEGWAARYSSAAGRRVNTRGAPELGLVFLGGGGQRRQSHERPVGGGRGRRRRGPGG
jgi:hypothetical protein